jgi:hypothetical protein
MGSTNIGLVRLAELKEQRLSDKFKELADMLKNDAPYIVAAQGFEKGMESIKNTSNAIVQTLTGTRQFSHNEKILGTLVVQHIAFEGERLAENVNKPAPSLDTILRNLNEKDGNRVNFERLQKEFQSRIGISLDSFNGKLEDYGKLNRGVEKSEQASVQVPVHGPKKENQVTI